MLLRRALALLAPGLAPFALAQNEPKEKRPPMFVAEASTEAQDQIKSFQLARGLVCDLVAAEPDLCNGVALTVDRQGRVFVAETFRIGDGVFDTRDYMQWRDDDLACQTVAERVAKYHKHIAAAIPRYSNYTERVRLLFDTDRNGSLDRAAVFADGFNDLADGIGSGVLVVDDSLYFANIPKLWRLSDRNDDGLADERIAVHDGFGVHTSLIGHDLHGLVLGPDRRLYFSIGDRGFCVKAGDRTFAYPNDGAVLRCELDGSDLEVVHRGLRNPQELAFDDAFDLFTGDNNSDGGDRARLVQIVPGGDSGWRIGFQWLDDRGAWNRERMWEPRHEEQTACILPPIANFADGPSGLVYDLGVGLPERFRGCFLLCDFRGGASNSGVHALRLARAGAGYELATTDRLIWHVLATDIEFAPDGSLYVLDWVHGWKKTGKGRIYRVRSPEMANDLTLRSGAALLASDLRQRPPAQLRELLGHRDRRLRQAAQFALVDLGAADVLRAAAEDASARVARRHGIFGLAILARKDLRHLEAVPALLDDGDADVRALAARALGDRRVAAAEPKLAARLTDPCARVRKEAALALARLGQSDATTKALIAMLRRNDDHDAVLRHAAAFALGAGARTEVLSNYRDDASAAVRLGVLLALAHKGDAAIAHFLKDRDARLRTDAARAIYDRSIAGAMRALAKLSYDDVPDTAALDWRAINANRMVGETENGEALVHLATLANHSAAARCEALAVLADWVAPHGQCRVTGNWRPCRHENPQVVTGSFQSLAPQLLGDAVTAEATANAIAKLRLPALAPALAAVVRDATAADAARLAALDALAELEVPEFKAALARIDGACPVPLRLRAIALLSHTAPEQAVPVLSSLLDNASLGERQAAFEALGGLQHAAAAEVLREWLERLAAGKVEPELALDVEEAAARHGSLEGLVAARREDQKKIGPLEPFQSCRNGGDAKAGRSIFFDYEATRCTRCHSLGEQGGNAGPALDGIGKRLTRDQLLEALVAPSARIAEGFGTTTLELHDGGVYVGVITKDQDGAVTIVDIAGKATDVPWGRIERRKPNTASAMPEMGASLSRRQLRDVIAFLADQQREPKVK